jgi:hypothetical protein
MQRRGPSREPISKSGKIVQCQKITLEKNVGKSMKLTKFEFYFIGNSPQEQKS